MTKSLIDDAM